MNTQEVLQKFTAQPQQIEELEKKSPRFRRIFAEYCSITQEFWDMQNSARNNISDELLAAIQLQIDFLERAIRDFLSGEKPVLN